MAAAEEESDSDDYFRVKRERSVASLLRNYLIKTLHDVICATKVCLLVCDTSGESRRSTEPCQHNYFFITKFFFISFIWNDIYLFMIQVYIYCTLYL